jgi:hypothetical protein
MRINGMQRALRAAADAERSALTQSGERPGRSWRKERTAMPRVEREP